MRSKSCKKTSLLIMVLTLFIASLTIQAAQAPTIQPLCILDDTLDYN